MTRIKIDPITRIEGHLKIEVEVEAGTVVNAWNSGTLFRGIEIILKGRQPEDAWIFTQRLCGVCTYVHGSASVKCVENVGNLTIPENARILRNLLMGSQYIHDHLIHFYLLQALDFVDVLSALKANPNTTADLAKAISPLGPSIDFAATKAKLQSFVSSGQHGIFAGGYWGHPAYTLSPEENLLFMAHYFYILKKQVDAAQMQTIFGGKNPHPQSLRVGGIVCHDDLKQSNIDAFASLLIQLQECIDKVYIPDVCHLASKYIDWTKNGGFAHYMAYGEFPQSVSNNSSFFFPQGIILNKNIENVQNINLNAIQEHVTRSWYRGPSIQKPQLGTTRPHYTKYDPDSRYSWIKAPRYNGKPMEVGPLARILIAYGRGKKEIRTSVDWFLQKTGLQLDHLHSTMGRSVARALETQLVANAMSKWLSQLSPGHNTMLQQFSIAGGLSQGVGLNEAPRGALGHWISIKDKVIDNYQMVVPSTWNLSPRCDANLPGPLEEALIGIPVQDVARPIEILRVVHSFDPCIACAVHVIDKKSTNHYTVRVL